MKSWKNPRDISFLRNCTTVLRSHTHHPEVASTSNRTKYNHHWLNHLQTLHTHTRARAHTDTHTHTRTHTH